MIIALKRSSLLEKLPIIRKIRALDILFWGVILLLIILTIFFITLSQKSEHFTEFYILDENGGVSDYPTRFWKGTNQKIIVGIGNHEQQNISYKVKVYGFNQQHDLITNTSKILMAIPLGSFPVEVPHYGRVEKLFNFSVNDTSINRIQLLLFDDRHRKSDLDIPAAELVEQSYLDLHFWVMIDEAKPFFRNIDRVIEPVRATDLTGVWVFYPEENTKLNLVQKGNSLWGDYDHLEYDFEDKIINGEISGNFISFRRVNYLNYQDYSGILTTDASGKRKIKGIFNERGGTKIFYWEAIKI